MINEEFHRLFEGNSYISKEDINIFSGRKVYENGYILQVFEQVDMGVEVRRDSSKSPGEYTHMKDYAPTAQPKIVRMEEPVTGETVINRKMFNNDRVNKRVQNKYPDLYEFFDGQKPSDEDSFDISEQTSVEVSVFIIFDSEGLSVVSDLFITDGSVVREPVNFSGFLFTIKEDKTARNVEETISDKYNSVIQQYKKYPTILEFPNGDHGEAAKYIDNNTDIKVVWVSDFKPFLILLPVQSESKIITELRNSGFEYNIEYE
jgi:hypothetical protein